MNMSINFTIVAGPTGKPFGEAKFAIRTSCCRAGVSDSEPPSLQVSTCHAASPLGLPILITAHRHGLFPLIRAGEPCTGIEDLLLSRGLLESGAAEFPRALY
ncbi:hypothetical protein KC19_1G009000 [Ceratodon purpureus]|uniref:Uncharacterized protein n=1 Tax=Ceratodon purpureus TaxID=3225 RepID=A0A8T0J0Z1_CERPU|nr:hypothetical protein KC19_1G009000 [Ceratodon purpureus]